jgi:hypothetical protein
VSIGLNKNSVIFFGSLFLISLFPFLFKIVADSPQRTLKKELFDPNLVRLNSLDKIVSYIDSLYASQTLPGLDTAAYVSIASETIKKRFCFGLSNYNISDNWIAYASGKLVWSHFLGIVDPNDILKHPCGLCSQQTIVFMEILKRKGVKVRSVGLGPKEGPGHFLCEVFYKDAWHLHDVTMEPLWKKVGNHHKSIEYYLQNKDSLYLAYQMQYDKPLFYKLLNKVEFGKTNEFPAKNMLLFHKFTLFFTYLMPLFFLFMFIRALRKQKNKNSTKVN